MNKKIKVLLCISAVIGMMNVSYAKDYGDITKSQTISGNNNTADSIDIGGSKAITNNGSITVSGDAELYGQAKLNNNEGSTFNIEGDITSYAKAVITNNGTLNLDGSFNNSEDNNSTSKFINNNIANIGGDLNNSTNVNNAGTLNIVGSFINSEVWEYYNSNTDKTTQKRASFTNTGTLNIQEGFENGSGAKFDNSGKITINGSISNAGNYEYTDDYDNEKTINTVFTNSGTITLDGDSATFTNDAKVTGEGILNLTNGAKGTNSNNVAQSELNLKDASEYTNSGNIKLNSLTISGAVYDAVTDPEDIPDIITEASSYVNEGYTELNTVDNKGKITNSGISSWEVVEKEDEDGNIISAKPQETKGGIIAQTINNDVNAEIDNSGYIKADLVANSGHITNTGKDDTWEDSSSIYQGEDLDDKEIEFKKDIHGGLEITELNNTKTGIIDGDGILRIGSGSNAGNITQGIINITSNFKNDGNLTSGTGFLNKGTISGKGSITLSGSHEYEYDDDDNITGNINDNRNEGTIEQDIVNIDGIFVNNGNIISNGEFSIDEETDERSGGFTNTGELIGIGNLTIKDGINDGTITQKDITISGNFENNGDITSNGKFSNTGNISGDSGNLILGDGSNQHTNNGTISQNDITINGNLLNDRKITSIGNFIANAAISGKGNLIINDGENNKGITQNNITINGEFNNNAQMTVKEVLTNHGEITNISNMIIAEIQNLTDAEINGEGSITISGGTNEGIINQNNITLNNSLTNNNTITSNTTLTNHAVIDGTGTLNIASGSSDKAITQDYINITGNFTNLANMTANEKLDNNAGTINNSAIITAVLDNSGTIQGDKGNLVINGGENSGVINQNGIIVNQEFSNTNTIVANLFQNDSTILGSTGSLTINTTGINNGSITQNSITNNGKFQNNKSITASLLTNTDEFINYGKDASLNINTLNNQNKFTVTDNANITLDNITNDKGTIQIANSSTLNIASQEKDLGGIINIDGGNNTFGVTGAEVNSEINIGKTASAILNFIEGTIKDTAEVNITDGSALIINGGNVNLNKNDDWSGSIGLTTGSLTISDINSNSQLVAEGGKLTIADNGILNIDNNSSILGAVDTVISGELNIQGGGVILNNNDKWKGTINLGTSGLENDTSTLIVSMTSEEMGVLHGENGNLIVDDLNLTIGNGSYIKEEVKIQTDGNIKITTGGQVAIDDNDILAQGAKLALDGGTLDYGRQENASAMVIGEKGNLNLLSGSILTISEGSNIKDAVALDIRENAILVLDKNLTLNLDKKDKWAGYIVNSNGTINADGVTEAKGDLIQSDGAINLSKSTITLNTNSAIDGGDINIEDNSNLIIINALLTGGDVKIDDTSSLVVKYARDEEFSLDSLTANGIKNDNGLIQAPLVDVMNSQLNRANIENLSIENQANFNIDILARSSKRNDSDKFVIGNLTGNGTIKLDDWRFTGDVFGKDAPIDRQVKLGSIFVDKDGNPLEATIETTDKRNFSPIGWYQLNKGAGAGNYTLDLVKFNPQVFRGQVATVSQWMNQLTIDDMLFTHSMVLPSFKEEDGGKMANHYASTDALFAPYQYSRKDGGIWYKTYGTFEHLQMNNGLKHVGNNAYGALIGADFGLKDLKNGWKFMPTAYVGYNGAHQYWSDVSQYQNGGQAGFLGTWYKDNFILGAMAYGGVYGNTMDVYGHTDETFNYFAGTAAKASYNIRVHRDFVIQPNLMAAYNYFGQQNWHSNFGQMGMMSGMLHGVNIAPGVNFIWERDTFSAYLTLQYMYNVNGASGGRAGNVHLPQLEMERGYIQYGIGFTKKFTDRASGYFQAVLRNVGRTGVGLQAGFLFRLGK